MPRRRISLRNREAGSVAAEFALIMPFVLILIFGTILFAFALYQWTMLEAAARAGVEYARINLYTYSGGGINYSEIENRVYAAVPNCWDASSGTNTCPGLVANVTDPYCTCYSGDPVACDNKGTCPLAGDPNTADTRKFKYVQVTVTQKAWSSGIFSLPTSLGAQATGRVQ